MNVPIKRLHPTVTLPEYQTAGAAAMDLHAAIDQPVALGSFERRVIPTGFAMELPLGYEAQIRPRSGLSLKQGLALANGVATIDSDYRGEIGVIAINLSKDTITIEPDQRIAQMVVAQHERVVWEVVDTLSESDRGEGAYGSTK